MLRLLALLLLLTLTACQQAMMTRQTFEQIPVGTPIANVQSQAGTPYEVIRHADGTKTHHYIERIEIGPGIMDQATYTLKVNDGQIVDKQCSTPSRTIDVRSP